MTTVAKKQKKVAVPPKKLKKCDICHKQSESEGDDLVLFGDWKESKGVCVHYFCLLLSTNLPQTGEDCSGILGFLMRDIRLEIKQAAKRICCFCAQPHASIACDECKEYFHLVCGTAEKCLFEFTGAYPSHCNKCLPLNEKQTELLKKPPSELLRCYICNDVMGPYNCVQWLYGPCCGYGFVHRICLLKFALNAGYYLRCLWCRDTRFRDLIRKFGIYIPDRDAMWEVNGNYTDLHRGYRRCDMVKCLCPQGRDYVNKKWVLVNCMLCGSFGAHNPICITRNYKSKETIAGFKCDVCFTAEQTIIKDKSERTLENLSKSTTLLENQEKELEEVAQIGNTASLELPVVSIEEPTSNRCCGLDSNSDNRVHVKTLEFEEKNGVVNCKGMVTLCINRCDERYLEKSLENIVTNNLFEDKDIICRTTDTGVFRIIDEIIADYANK